MKNRVLIAVVVWPLMAACLANGAFAGQKDPEDVAAEAKVFLDNYQKKLAELELKVTTTEWAAANSGKTEDYDASAAAKLAMRKFHSDAEAYETIRRLLKDKRQLKPLQARALDCARRAFEANQLPPEMLAATVKLSTEIEHVQKTFRGRIDDRKYSNNDLLEILSQQTDSAKRKTAWEALKQVGGAVGPKLVELARLRNKAAAKLGYDNYWDMKIRLQEHDPKQLLGIFAELRRLSDEPFGEMKARLDGELSRRFKVPVDQIMPWHYDNPFFQAAPPSEKIDLDEFYKGKTKQQIVELAVKFFADVGLPIDEIVARSDLYEREGKDQHAFCISIDRAGDVRTLCNIKPTAEWMDTMLHEQGHAVYDVHVDRSLPFNLRDPAHAFTTEGVAMLFGALAKNPTWLTGYAGADPKRVAELTEAIFRQRTREQLIFARWTLVMLHFEKALYEDPGQELNSLWWDYVERFQQLRRPPGREVPDWAAKPHFTIAPVYYHNYMLGELFAAQVRHVLAQKAGHQGPPVTLSFNGRKEFGRFLKQKAFRPGNALPWPKFVRRVTGQPLTARYFAEEVRN